MRPPIDRKVKLRPVDPPIAPLVVLHSGQNPLGLNLWNAESRQLGHTSHFHQFLVVGEKVGVVGID